jgi:hypothetical protein
MGLWGKLFGARPTPPSSDHCVLVHFRLSDDKFGTHDERDAVHQFSDTLAALIEQHSAGEFDGDEFGGGEGTLFMYGPDADRLFGAIEPALKTWEPLRGGHVIKRHGGPGSREERIEF